MSTPQIIQWLYLMELKWDGVVMEAVWTTENGSPAQRFEIVDENRTLTLTLNDETGLDGRMVIHGIDWGHGKPGLSTSVLLWAELNEGDK